MEQMPVFVKLEKPADLKAQINAIKSMIAKTQERISDLKSLIAEESVKMAEWRSNFDHTNYKISEIQASLVEPERS
jgi:peptidoglycan hydrolase CwlO-like protein